MMAENKRGIMKRRTSVIVLAFCTLFALRAVTASASESFTLNIPVRGNAQQETGEVRITLTLDTPSAGAQLVVNGNTTVNLGQTQSVGGDSVIFETAGGNDVRITYKPLSNFGADFCAGGGALEKNIPMRFVGPQDVTEYRVTTYIVAAPAVECSAVSKHTGDTPASLIPVDDGVAPALVAANRGRHPFDVVLVLDKSGSMADLPPGTGPSPMNPSKAQILKSAITTFVSQWAEIDQPTMDGGEWSHDRLGVVFFDSVPAAQTLVGADPPANVFLQRGSQMPPGAWAAVSSTVNALTPGGSTSIGGGINEAMSQWKADPAHDLSLIVVTDGIQNTAPLIDVTASGFLGLLPVSGFPLELRKRFVPIQTIGFGTPAAVDETLLKNISLETSGVSYISANASAMFDALGMTLVALLKGNTISMALSHHDTLSAMGFSTPQPVLVDRSAQRVMFTVQWAPPLVGVADLEVVRPNGVVATPDSAEKTPQSSIQTFNIKPGDVGAWNVRVKHGLRKSRLPVPYALSAIILERHLDYRLSFEPPRKTGGDAITIRAVVDWDGKRLAGLPDGAIRIRVHGPTAALGNILHDSPFVDRSKGTTTTPAGDRLTPYDRKIAALSRDLIKRMQPKDFGTITMREESHGVYAATFDQTSIPGSYSFDAILDWDTERTGHTKRIEHLEQLVTVKADREKSSVVVTRRDAHTVRIAATPRDKNGNYLGPGYATSINAKLRSAGKLSGPIDRQQTGTYVFTVTDIPARTMPDLEISVAGVVIGNRAPR
jgi:hypothetical protein